ncbi:MAG TPA: TonB-dependent receptor [Ignavibacteriales bacterium]|nr:TonB-dependent receptor [Ignavibacteriales bacterium]
MTQKNLNEGLTFKSNITTTPKGDFISDIFVAMKNNDLSIKIASRLERSNLTNFIDFDSYEYTSSKYHLDTLLWTKDWINKIFNKGKYNINQNYTYLDFRINYQKTEVGFTYNSKYDNWGNADATDRVFNRIPFYFDTYNFWIEQTHKFSDEFSTQFSLSYKIENLQKGDWFEGYNITNTSDTVMLIGGEFVDPGKTVRVLNYSYWPAENRTLSYMQNFEFLIHDNISIITGINYEYKDISKQKGYYGKMYTVGKLLSNFSDLIPDKTDTYNNIDNIFTWKDMGIFSQIRYIINSNGILHSGIRIDDNSEYGTSTTFRAGFVGNYDLFGVKVLYGQAYRIPTPRTLYTNYTVFGSSTSLKPERSETFELQVNQVKSNFTSFLSTYYVRNRNTIALIAGGAKNLGTRNIVGVDVYANYLVPNFIKKLHLWACYSTYIYAKEEIFDANGVNLGKVNIGDLSNHKIYFGGKFYFTRDILFNFRSRYIGERKTVITNPINKVDAYFVMDANFLFKNAFVDGFNLSLTIDNIFDTKYYHPGIGYADAGDQPGSWVNGVWQGSSGWQASLIPQPHRNIFFTLSLDL